MSYAISSDLLISINITFWEVVGQSCPKKVIKNSSRQCVKTVVITSYSAESILRHRVNAAVVCCSFFRKNLFWNLPLSCIHLFGAEIGRSEICGMSDLVGWGVLYKTKGFRFKPREALSRALGRNFAKVPGDVWVENWQNAVVVIGCYLLDSDPNLDAGQPNSW